VVAVPDSRLDELAKMYNPELYTPAVIEFVDIAGLVRGASKGEGLGNKFLSHIREVDAVVHVVRCFENNDIIHVDGSVDPIRDVETINLELIFSDIEIIERRIDNLKKAMKGDKTLAPKVELYERVLAALMDGKTARSLDYTEEEAEMMGDVALLTIKPVIYAANISESDIGSDLNKNPYYQKVVEFAASEKSEVIPVCAEIEAEIAELDGDDKEMFLADLGIEESGLDRLIKASYSLLGLISYLTAGPKEVRAWTIVKGTKAPQAAGKIHSDFERGFIRAEIVAFDDLMACGTMTAAKEKGLVRSEGKEYVIADGDIVLFRFNV
jgi:GTP-binding protein YchF